MVKQNTLLLLQTDLRECLENFVKLFARALFGLLVSFEHVLVHHSSALGALRVRLFPVECHSQALHLRVKVLHQLYYSLAHLGQTTN